ncbi:hypothetical protein XTALMG727_3254 [Xanthomonas translucens pv. arrhenatheri LMG 727]|uniref:Uncharacterized protein n=1 Tax=Xanthomonas graminis pv. arrhenatheri LMG 727 TaxID=1195923 RepID=A0A0K3A631_9XANT|nr:DUF1631 domain-containing protein [Xanthomonas translucens]CTP90950.1 hypothetical protein XTALMG727_3254 [Xanthomonas translucens pv. arrhenatheri LMG 727]
MIIAEYAEELLPSRNSDLLDQVREVVSVPLAEAFGEVLDVLADALLRMAERAGAMQNDYFEAIQLLRQQREPIAARFRGHLAQAWQALEAGRPLSVERTLARAATSVWSPRRNWTCAWPCATWPARSSTAGARS